MAVELRDARLVDRERLERLLADYLFEFDGSTDAYPYLDLYWTEPERLPFLIVVDGEAVGLCLIRRRRDGWDIAEFSVVSGQRRRGFGSAAVEALAAHARSEGVGYLEAKVHPGNERALPFWFAVGFSVVKGRLDTAVTVTRRHL